MLTAVVVLNSKNLQFFIPFSSRFLFDGAAIRCTLARRFLSFLPGPSHPQRSLGALLGLLHLRLSSLDPTLWLGPLTDALPRCCCASAAASSSPFSALLTAQCRLLLLLATRHFHRAAFLTADDDLPEPSVVSPLPPDRPLPSVDEALAALTKLQHCAADTGLPATMLPQFHLRPLLRFASPATSSPARSQRRLSNNQQLLLEAVADAEAEAAARDEPPLLEMMPPSLDAADAPMPLPFEGLGLAHEAEVGGGGMMAPMAVPKSAAPVREPVFEATKRLAGSWRHRQITLLFGQPREPVAQRPAPSPPSDVCSDFQRHSRRAQCLGKRTVVVKRKVSNRQVAFADWTERVLIPDWGPIL